ncbi:MAG: hypothetical protein E4G89_03605 [Methanothrix sp.]|nr:MAG: hypothetical protein E4G89_03605 [Methanothrix sp.]
MWSPEIISPPMNVSDWHGTCSHFALTNQENQADEVQAVYFDSYIIEVHGNRTPESGQYNRFD